jgi:TDG/mug DNA glycosylase family protein
MRNRRTPSSDIGGPPQPPLLPDRAGPGVRVLFVGINPGMRSAAIGHHFAGYSNRFWKLLFESELVPEAIGPEDDRRLPEWGFGITNLVPRPTPGIDTLTAPEYVAGEKRLRAKVRRWKPAIVAFVGVTLYRSVFHPPVSTPVACGPQREQFEGARVFVVPNPSGRNANYSYQEMLAAYRTLARAARRAPR